MVCFLPANVCEIICHVAVDFSRCEIYGKSDNAQIAMLHVISLNYFLNDCFRSTEVEQSILEDLRNRVQLSSVALPSVSFFTFLNTHNG